MTKTYSALSPRAEPIASLAAAVLFVVIATVAALALEPPLADRPIWLLLTISVLASAGASGVLAANIAGDYDGTGSAMLLADEHDREASNKTTLEAPRAVEDVVWSWSDETGFAAKAVLDAAALAEEVQIFMVRDGAEPTDAAQYLSRHNIRASIRIVHDGLAAADQLIADEASNWHADYILMGAFGRGRLMETFVGVTKHTLAHSKLPLILGH